MLSRSLKLLVLLSMHSGTAVVAFQYKKDTLEDCVDRTKKECQTSSSSSSSSSTLWFQCPIVCSNHFQGEASMAEIQHGDDPEAFFRLTVLQHEKNGNKLLSLQDLEGYVTLFAVVPMKYRGMAKFYYDMLEHVATIYPFTVQIIVLPWRSSKDEEHSKEEQGDDGDTSIDAVFAPQRYQTQKVVLLEPASRPTQALEYLLNVPIVAGNGEDVSLKEDRVTTFLVTSDGMFVERLVSPTITLLERRLAVFLLQLSMSPEL